MFKKSVTYKDIDGETVTEEFHFHLDEAELMELELGMNGETFSDTVAKAVKKESGGEVIAAFKRLITLSIGKREGKKFRKNPEILSDLMETGAYSALFMELATDADAGSAFVTGLMSSEVQARVAQAKLVEAMKDKTNEMAVAELAQTPVWPTAETTTPAPEADTPASDIPKHPTIDQLSNMTPEEFRIYKEFTDALRPVVPE